MQWGSKNRLTDVIYGVFYKGVCCGNLLILLLGSSGCTRGTPFFGRIDKSYLSSQSANSPDSTHAAQTGPESNPIADPIPPPLPTDLGPLRVERLTQDFPVGASQQKVPVDMLFVVDNSGSMATSQSNLSEGFKAFAQSYFKEERINVCVAVTTSDRYLSRGSEYIYGSVKGKDRYLNPLCSNPDEAQSWDQAKRDAHLASYIDEFTTKVNVGTSGSSYELLGKSLATFLNDRDTWDSPVVVGKTNSFFRKNALANITFVTDENNWTPLASASEVVNLVGENGMDLPPVLGASYPSTVLAQYLPSPPDKRDYRNGIKNVLDDFFSHLNEVTPDQLTYSVTSILTPSSNGTYGCASGCMTNGINLAALVGLVGRDSFQGNVQASATDYANLYSSLGHSILNRAKAFTLSSPYYEPDIALAKYTLITLKHADGTKQVLTYGTDYTRIDPNQILVSNSLYQSLKASDVLTIEYVHIVGN